MKGKVILIVPCQLHLWLHDIDQDGKLLRDCSYERVHGELVELPVGHNVGNALQSWRDARDNAIDKSWQDEVLVIGQPSAWCPLLLSI